MVTSIKPNKFHDPTCVLGDGDHDFIEHPSYLLYRMAETMPAAHIGKMVDKNFYITRDDLTEAVYSRIAAGIYQSDQTPLRIVRYARERGIGF